MYCDVDVERAEYWANVIGKRYYVWMNKARVILDENVNKMLMYLPHPTPANDRVICFIWWFYRFENFICKKCNFNLFYPVIPLSIFTYY